MYIRDHFNIELIYLQMIEVIQKMNTIDLEVHLQILRGLLEVDQNQTPLVLLQG